VFSVCQRICITTINPYKVQVPLLIRKTLASALTSLEKNLANNLRDQTLAKKWKFKKTKKKTKTNLGTNGKSNAQDLIKHDLRVY
jgi:hypothetical protein